MHLTHEGHPAPTSGQGESPDTRRRPKRGALPFPSAAETLVCPLGGVGEIGMNWTLFGHAGKWILVDAGSSFAPRGVEGVEAIFPDPSVLTKLGDAFLGLVVTHFHEDHVGAIHRLWPLVVNVPIHAPPFASAMLTNRFREKGVRGAVDVREYVPGDTLSIGPFSVATLDVGHSTPDCAALAVTTPAGRILHTGDWKLDPEPGIGRRTNLGRFRELGRLGVDLMLCDSTNADRERPMQSEASVRRAFEEAFSRARGMVVVASFGSNVARMASVARAAHATGRRVALAGSALKRAYDVAGKLGMLDDVPPLLTDPARLDAFDRRQTVLMCTGTQGEERAALTKISERFERLPRIRAGDIVVHSARVIPGNEDSLYPVLNRLEAQGAEIVTAENWSGVDPIHVSGHPSRDELRSMYEVVLPRTAMPIHGTPHHLEAHAELARSLDVPEVVVPSNGAVFSLRDGTVRHIATVPVRLVAVLDDRDGTMVRWDPVAMEPVRDARPALATSPAPARGGRHGRDRTSASPSDAKEGKGKARAKDGRKAGAGKPAKAPVAAKATGTGRRDGRRDAKHPPAAATPTAARASRDGRRRRVPA